MAGSSDKKGQEAAPSALEGMTPEQLEAVHEELRQNEQLVLQSKLDEQRQKREQELLKGKPKKVEKVNVEEIKFTREERKPGLPEKIRKLPKDHPLRLMFEKGFKQQRAQAGKRSAGWTQQERGISPQELRELSKTLAILLLILGLIGGIYHFTEQYQSSTGETRHRILAAIKEKNYTPEHPKVEKEFKRLYWSNWLPDLKRLLGFVEGLGMNYEVFDGNPEPGSYTDYIKRHNKPFNQVEAMEWYAREIRKPSWAQSP